MLERIISLPVRNNAMIKLFSLIFVSMTIVFLSACSSALSSKTAAQKPSSGWLFGRAAPSVTVEELMPVAKTPVGNYSAPVLTGHYANSAKAQAFINKMAREHDYDREYLNGLFATLEHQQSAIRLMDRYAPSTVKRPPGYVPQPSRGSWTRYRNNFITPANLDRGTQFWLENEKTLQQAELEYGVPAEIIVGIIGVETRWGRIMGNYAVIDAISTIAFDYPRRADYFSSELEAFLLMAREEQIDPRQPMGSYAGAMGLGQFMPSSFRQWAVDFDGDGVRDLWEPTDAIASVANYLRAHGWQTNQPVAIPASYSGHAYRQVKWGFNSNYSLGELQKVGILPSRIPPKNQVSLLRFANQSNDELWLGLDNFEVITKYNKSSMYAMAVYQLGTNVEERARRYRQASDLSPEGELLVAN